MNKTQIEAFAKAVGGEVITWQPEAGYVSIRVAWRVGFGLPYSASSFVDLCQVAGVKAQHASDYTVLGIFKHSTYYLSE